MLTLLYPKDDYSAADVAIRVQALAAGEQQKIQVIPKHFGRAPAQVEKQLKNTTEAIFIARDTERLDAETAHELKTLKQQCRVMAVVPDNFADLPSQVERYEYVQGDNRAFIQSVQKLVGEWATKPPGDGWDQESGARLLLIGALIVAAIILLANLDKPK